MRVREAKKEHINKSHSSRLLQMVENLAKMYRHGVYCDKIRFTGAQLR